jgi:hypothetical protein
MAIFQAFGRPRIAGRQELMATKIKIVTGGDFLEVTPEGVINLATSRQLLVDIARSGGQPVDYDLLIDFREWFIIG